VLVCVSLLVAGRVVNVFVPIYNKRIGKKYCPLYMYYFTSVYVQYFEVDKHYNTSYNTPITVFLS